MWESVRRGEEKNIFPFQEEADAMFNSALVYEFAVLKQYAEPLLFGIPKDSEEYLEAKPEIADELSAAERRKRAQLKSKPVYRYVALAIFLFGTAAAAYGLYAVFTHTGSYGVYFALFGFAAIFLFSSYNMLPTAHNNNSAIMKRADQADAAMAEYVKHYPNGSFPVPSCYAHPIVLKRMIDAVEEGQAVTTAEALDAVKARLQAVNADVQVEQEEYDEIVAIKALFLNHDYQ